MIAERKLGKRMQFIKDFEESDEVGIEVFGRGMTAKNLRLSIERLYPDGRKRVRVVETRGKVFLVKP